MTPKKYEIKVDPVETYANNFLFYFLSTLAENEFY